MQGGNPMTASASMGTRRKRKSVDQLTTPEKDKLITAWRGIQRLDPKLDNSFFKLAGYHGEPFRGAGWGNSAYWGGYCNHGNVLFPTWHRVYLWQLENALRSIENCQDVTLPYWDETSDSSQKYGIPKLFTEKEYTFNDGNGPTIPNPLYSYRLQKKIVDHLSPVPDADYSKYEGYSTVRYPLSGLVGTPKDRAATEKHNNQFTSEQAVKYLNDNIVNWLTNSPVVDGKPINRGHVVEQYKRCLTAPNYTAFSNTTSCAAWNDDNNSTYLSLESPHNNIHLAVGGFDLPALPGGDYSPIPGANGDMGENDTASFDPIFYFHHCFVDLVFWLWQKRNKATSKLEIIPEYPGTNTVDNQGPTPGAPPNSWLNDTSPLEPFKKENDWYTSKDCADITALGYDYDYSGILSGPPQATADTARSSRAIYVSGIDRTKIKGSFLVSALAEVDGEQHHLGTEGVLSRWHVEGCANCQTHLRASATFPLLAELIGFDGERFLAGDVALKIQIRTHAGPQESQIPTPTDTAFATTLIHTADDGTEMPFRAEVRPITSEQPEGA